MRYKRVLLIVLRFIIGFGLLYFLFWKMDTSKIIEILKQTNLIFIVVASICFLSAIVVVSWRWKLILSAHSIAIPFHKTVAYYLVGFFFNNFLPTVIGLDLIRAVYASNNYGKKAECFASVISEKVIGLLAIPILGVVSLSFFIMKDRCIRFIFLGLLCLTILFLAGIFLFLQRKNLQRFAWLFRIRILSKLKDKTTSLYDAIYYYKDRKAVFFLTLLFSVFYQGILITMVFLIGRALLITIPFYYYLAFIPVINIGSMIPLTPNGIGIREGLYVYLFNLAGVESSQSILISIIYFGIVMLISLSGGVIFMFGIKREE